MSTLSAKYSSAERFLFLSFHVTIKSIEKKGMYLFDHNSYRRSNFESNAFQYTTVLANRVTSSMVDCMLFTSNFIDWSDSSSVFHFYVEVKQPFWLHSNIMFFSCRHLELLVQV